MDCWYVWGCEEETEGHVWEGQRRRLGIWFDRLKRGTGGVWPVVSEAFCLDTLYTLLCSERLSFCVSTWLSWLWFLCSKIFVPDTFNPLMCDIDLGFPLLSLEAHLWLYISPIQGRNIRNSLVPGSPLRELSHIVGNEAYRPVSCLLTTIQGNPWCLKPLSPSQPKHWSIQWFNWTSWWKDWFVF